MSWQNVSNNEEGMEVLASIPNLDKRVKNFLEHLELEPCAHHAVEEIRARLEAGSKRPRPEFRACDVLSNSRAMCPACRIRLRFYHCVFNGGAYDPSLDEQDA